MSLRDKTATIASIPSGIHISLGVMDYIFTGNKPVKYDDANDKALLATLTRAAQKDISLARRASYYSVMAFNTDKTQVRLGYGCYDPTSPMFAVKTNGTWRLLSPTNHFDVFGNPDCDYVTQYSIDRLVAPVCVSNRLSSSGPLYTVR